jgi:hypothetical protein
LTVFLSSHPKEPRIFFLHPTILWGKQKEILNKKNTSIRKLIKKYLINSLVQTLKIKITIIFFFLSFHSISMSTESKIKEDEEDQIIKPTDEKKSTSTSHWPLLLKNYDKMEVLTGHFTPLTCGSSPLKRPLQEYIKFIFSTLFIASFFFI